MFMHHYVKINAQRGIVLFFVLIIMQVLALLSWVSVQAVLLEQKMVQADFQRHILFVAGEAALAKVENIFSGSQPTCLIPPITAQELLAKPLSWWHSSLTCAGIFQAFQYYYVVEALGEDACANIMDSQARADYYRITLFMQSHL